MNAQVAKEKCDRLAGFRLDNVTDLLESLESFLVPEREDISHAFQAVKGTVEQTSGRCQMLKAVADCKEKLYGEWTSMKDHAKDAEDFRAAQQAKAQCLALEALQLSDDMSYQELSATKGVLEHSSDAIRAAKRLRTVYALQSSSQQCAEHFQLAMLIDVAVSVAYVVIYIYIYINICFQSLMSFIPLTVWNAPVRLCMVRKHILTLKT